MTVAQASEYLQVSRTTVDRYVKHGLPHIRLFTGTMRFRQNELDAWLSKQKRNFPQLRITHQPVFTFRREMQCIDRGQKQAVVAKSQRARTRYCYLGRSGSVFKRRSKKWGMRFYINFVGRNGKRIQKIVKHARTVEEASAALLKAFEGIEAEQAGFKKPERIMFRDFADKYIEKYAQINKRNWRTDASYLKGICQAFGERFLDEISAEEIEGYKAVRLEKDRVEKSTVNRCLAIMRKLFNVAAEWGYLRKDEVPKFRLFPEGNVLKERTLSEDEERRLLEASSPHLRSILTVALHSGCRLGEILGLKWDQVDLQGRTLRIERTKNNKIRLIPLNTTLERELSRLFSSRDGSGFVFPNPETGEAFGSVKTAFYAACRRAKIEGLRFHDLRHTFATRLIARGVDIITVKDLLGHSSVRITEKYAHSNISRKKEAVKALDGQNLQKIGLDEASTCKIRDKSDFSPPVTLPSPSPSIN